MTKPDFPIDTPAKVTQAREYLGLDKKALALALRFRTGGRDNVRRLEDGTGKGVPGPTQIALEALVNAKGAEA